MSEFCKDCSIKIFGEDYREFAGLAKDGEYAIVICEECGHIEVDKDGKKIKGVKG